MEDAKLFVLLDMPMNNKENVLIFVQILTQDIIMEQLKSVF